MMGTGNETRGAVDDMTMLTSVCRDLAEEHEALDVMVADLESAAWNTPTPAPGWLVRDQIAHLAYYDAAAALALRASHTFREQELGTTQEEREQRHVERGRALEPPALLAWWRAARASLLDALKTVDPRLRVPWYGPSMGAISFATARLMETWAHGRDVADALGINQPVTNRLRHIAHLGVRARAYSYEVHGKTPPTGDVRVELTGPDGQTWEWGDPKAADRIQGSALDFCLVVTRRRHVADTSLHVEGSHAREWMVLAQAFAGSPGSGPSRRQRTEPHERKDA